MIDDKTLLKNGMKLLIEHLGLVEAERFIYLTQKEKFDYTEWHGTLYEGMSIRELSSMAMKRLREKETRNNENDTPEPFNDTKFFEVQKKELVAQ
jgi:hypothetical protein